MKFKRIIFSDLIFFLIIILLVILSIFSYTRIIDLNKQSDYVSHTNLVKLKLEQVLSYLKDAEGGQRGYLLTKDSAHLQPYFEAFSKHTQTLSDIDSLIKGNKSQQRNFTLLQWLVTKRLQRLETVIDSSGLASFQTDDLLNEGKLVMDQVRGLTAGMIEIEDRVLNNRTREKKYSAFITPLSSLVLSVFAILMVALAYFILRAEIRLRFNAEDSIKKLNDYFKDLPAVFSIVKGPDHVFEMANNLFHNVTGNREPTGKPLLEALPELQQQGLRELLDEVYTTGEPYTGREMPVELYRNDDLVKGYYNFIFQPILNKSRTVEGILIFGYEITEMIQARNKVKETELRSRLAIEAANIGTFDWDMENKVFISSPRLIEIFGFKDKDVVTHEELVSSLHPDDKPARDKAVAESYSKGKLAYEARVIWPDGSVRWVNVYGKIIHSASKDVRRMYGTVLDITEQRTILQELINSEAQFRLLADSMPQFVWTTDVNGKLSYFSKALTSYSGLTMDELLNDEWINLIHADERETFKQKWDTAISLGDEFNFEHRVKNNAGEYRWHLSRALPQKDAAGVLQRWVGTSTDIQDQKNLSQRLEQQINERTKELGQLNKQLIIKNNIFAEAEVNSMIGSYSWNLQTAELEYSDNLYRLFGAEPQEFVPSFEHYLSLIHPDDKEQVMKDGLDTLATKSLVAHTYRIVTKDGKTKHFRSTGKIYGNDENAMLIGTVQDVSQDKLFNDLLQAKNLELERSNAELESFNYIASHDLQEPLRKIQAFSQRILAKEAEGFSDAGRDYFLRIQAAAARMQNLIDALLSYSKTNASNLIPEETNLNILITDVISDLQEVSEGKNAVIRLKDLPTLNLVAIQAHQLFINLVGNAIKYNRPGIQPEITIHATMVPGKELQEENVNDQISYWKISVADNGIGFEQQYAGKIFELFQRLHGNRDYIGTGIGLAICKKIMRNHHGFISATGNPGVGSTFDVYFPAG